MPFASQAQRRFFYAAEARGELPKGTAARWQKETGKKKLPERKQADKTAAWEAGVIAGLEKIAKRLAHEDDEDAVERELHESGSIVSRRYASPRQLKYFENQPKRTMGQKTYRFFVGKDTKKFSDKVKKHWQGSGTTKEDRAWMRKRR